MKNIKFMYAIGFIVMTLFGIFYYQDILFAPKSLSTNPTLQNKESVTFTTTDRKFNVEGMFCESCKKKIEGAVSKLPGVVNVNVDQATNEMVVTYKESNENIKQTLSIVKELGYTAGLKSSSGRLQVMDFNVTFQ